MYGLKFLDFRGRFLEEVEMKALYEKAFWSCFWGVAMIGNFAVLPLVIVRIMMSNDTYNEVQLSIFLTLCAFLFVGVAFVVAWVVPLYANVFDRMERVRRLVQICRFGQWMMFYANAVGLLIVFWQKVLEPGIDTIIFLFSGRRSSDDMN